MEEKYWNEFMESGKVMDYLYFKGLGICSRVMDKYAGEGKAIESDYCYRDGDFCHPDWGI